MHVKVFKSVRSHTQSPAIAASCDQHGSRSDGLQRTDSILSTSQSDLNIAD